MDSPNFSNQSMDPPYLVFLTRGWPVVITIVNFSVIQFFLKSVALDYWYSPQITFENIIALQI
jgi:hypothetical protein